MSSAKIVYIPAGVPTFHMESAAAAFEQSLCLLRRLCPHILAPEGILFSSAAVAGFVRDKHPDLIVFENITFANAAYLSEALRLSECPVLLWTLPEPVVDGGRLRLNSLTGAYSAATALDGFHRPFFYLFGGAGDPRSERELAAVFQATEVRCALRSLRLAAVGHTPEGFGFGRALDAEVSSVFGATLESVEVRELIKKAVAYAPEDCREALEQTRKDTVGFDKTPPENAENHARLLKAYLDYARDHGIGALASRCWPDLFTDFGTPVCAALSMLNDAGIAAACEADIYGALSMWIGMQLSGGPVFFGDPVSLNEEENTLTFWHCGAAACSLARKDTGAVIGVHPNRKIGPAMDFGCEAAESATIFRVSRTAEGRFRFFLCRGSILDKPKQFIGTSVVVKTENPCREIVEKSVKDCFEPHFAVIRGDHAAELTALAQLLSLDVCAY